MLQMYDTWIDAVEGGDLAGVCMVDTSAAFDVVDIQILLENSNCMALIRIQFSGLGAT